MEFNLAEAIFLMELKYFMSSRENKTYQHDCEAGKMGGSTVGLVVAGGEGLHPVCGPVWKQ